MPGPAEEILTFGPLTLAIRATAEVTGGAFSVLEELPPLADTPPHLHANEDEYFHAVDGEHIITIGTDEHRIGPGEGVFAPRGIAHAQKRVEPGVGRMLLLCSPGGLEGFFRLLAQADTDGTLGPEAYASASEKYGITWL